MSLRGAKALVLSEHTGMYVPTSLACFIFFSQTQGRAG